MMVRVLRERGGGGCWVFWSMGLGEWSRRRDDGGCGWF